MGVHIYSNINDLGMVLNAIASGEGVNKTPADGSASPLHNAAFHGNVEMIRALLDAGADANWATTDEYRRSPLETAAFYGHVDAVRVLIDAGADVNYHPPDWPMENVLSTAARYGHTEVVRELLAAGASVDGGAEVGALHSAVRFQDQEMERLLVEAGANEYALPVIVARARNAAGRLLGHVDN